VSHPMTQGMDHKNPDALFPSSFLLSPFLPHPASCMQCVCMHSRSPACLLAPVLKPGPPAQAASRSNSNSRACTKSLAHLSVQPRSPASAARSHVHSLAGQQSPQDLPPTWPCSAAAAPLGAPGALGEAKGPGP
jgi:hypothetical protein